MPRGIPTSLSTLKQVTGTNQAANTEVSETVPDGKYWELVSVTVQLVQGLTQTPQPILVLDDGADVFFQSLGATAAQSASTNARYTWAPGLAVSGLIGTTPNIHAFAPLPDGVLLGPGFRIRTSTLGIGANSDYGAPSLLVIEYG